MPSLINKLRYNAGTHRQLLTWGYGRCDIDVSQTRRLQELEYFIHLQKKFGGRCLNVGDLEVFFKKVRVATSPAHTTSQTTSNDGELTRWMHDHPTCIPRPYYVTYCESLMCRLQLSDITVEVVELICSLDVDILVEEGRCDLALPALVVKDLTGQGCNVDMGVVATQTQCDLAVNVASQQLTCNIDTTVVNNLVKITP